MRYSEFLERVMELILEELGDGYEVEIHKVTKNNGVILDGLTICTKDERAFPVVYLNGYYGRYQAGTAIESIVAEILGACQDRDELAKCDIIELKNFDELKDKVVCKLINAEANQDLLKEIPHILWLDLAVVFYLMLGQNQYGQTTALIFNCQMNAWKTTVQDMEKLAKQNTQKLMPAEVKSMDDVVVELVHDAFGAELSECILEQMAEIVEKPPLYIMSNEYGINGAVCMLMNDALGDLADRFGKDLVILPSSVHEILITPFKEDLNFSKLSAMVTEINQDQVPEEDVLSNRVYRFCREEKLVCMVDIS